MKVEGEELIRKFEKITSAAYISLLLRAEERGQVLLSTATSPPLTPSLANVRVDVRRCRGGLLGRGCVLYITREKTFGIDNLLEELARVHANF